MTTRDKDEWFDGEDPDDGPDAADATAGDDDPPAAVDDLPVVEDAEVEPDVDDQVADAEARLFADLESAFDPDAGDDQGASRVAAERDEYRDALFRVKADFENYKKRIAKDHAATVERAAEKLVSELLPVLDACEAAIGQGLSDVEPVYKSLVDTLEKGGLQRVCPDGEPFDPNLHEVVMHEPGDGDEHIVIETLRTGYTWNGRVLRPAMVKVRG